MNVLIVEDEIPAAEKLERYLKKYSADIQVLQTTTSISETSEWLKGNQSSLDLIFMDIQLTDGLSFEIFNRISVEKPVIFITAFDEYAIDAFKVNSIAYLLKPITFMDLSSALQKLDQMKKQLGDNTLNEVVAELSQKQYKSRFMVKVGEHIRSIKTGEIQLFYAEGRTVYLINADQRKFIIDFKMEDLEDMLDPKEFYRLNRTFIININAIDEVLVYSNSRLKVLPKIGFDKEMIVSRDKVSDFKDWLSGGNSSNSRT